ncbi:hypothetical protein HB771_09285 [Rhizobium leguminosarum bv. viciae]|nr:hypothetical protein HB771_09285 [Rhizobium leguminosarum bv. viciae]
MSVEVFDDIAIHLSDGTPVLEQSKSALSGNPATDRSVELWKTLANWAELPDDYFKMVMCFRFYVTPIKTGDLVIELHNAKKAADIKILLDRFKTKKLQGKADVGIAPYVKRFLAAGDDGCTKIIELFELVTDADPVDPIRDKLTALIPDETLDQFCAAAIGQAKNSSDKLIRRKQPGILDANGFRGRWRAFIRKYEFSNLLTPTIGVPAAPQIAAVVTTLPTFVRQLTEIGSSESSIRNAVSDFLRTVADKVKWAEDGDIVESSLDELDVSLLRHHELADDELADTHAHIDPPARGRELYRRCTKLDLPLEGRAVPTYFVSGEFNCLADECRLGWHPDYKIMFPAV